MNINTIRCKYLEFYCHSWDKYVYKQNVYVPFLYFVMYCNVHPNTYIHSRAYKYVRNYEGILRHLWSDWRHIKQRDSTRSTVLLLLLRRLTHRPRRTLFQINSFNLAFYCSATRSARDVGQMAGCKVNRHSDGIIYKHTPTHIHR